MPPRPKRKEEALVSDDDDLGIVGDLEEEMLQFGHKVDNSREAGAILLSGRAGANARSRRHVNKIATLERPGSCAGSRAGSRPGSALRVRNGRPSLAKEDKPILSKSSSFLPAALTSIESRIRPVSSSLCTEPPSASTLQTWAPKPLWSTSETSALPILDQTFQHTHPCKSHVASPAA